MHGARPLTNDEIKNIVITLRNHGGRYMKRNIALFILGIHTGFRISELLSIRLKDIITGDDKFTNMNKYSAENFINDNITIAKQYMKGKKESRTIPIGLKAKEILYAYIQDWDEIYDRSPSKTDFLFESQMEHNGKSKSVSIRQMQEILSRAFEANMMQGKLGSHCMRKTFAQSVHNIFNKDIIKTQHALGHKYITSTQHYLSFDNHEIQDGIKQINYNF